MIVVLIIIGIALLLILFVPYVDKQAEKEKIKKQEDEEKAKQKEEDYVNSLKEEYYEKYKDLSAAELEVDLSLTPVTSFLIEEKVERAVLEFLKKKKEADEFKSFFYDEKYVTEGCVLMTIREKLELIPFFIKYRNMDPIPEEYIKRCEDYAAMMEVEKVKSYSLTKLTTWMEKHKPYSFSTVIEDYYSHRKKVYLKEEAFKSEVTKLKRAYNSAMKKGDSEKMEEIQKLYEASELEITKLREFPKEDN